MNRYLINGVVIKQPDEGLGYGFETTYTEDSTRVQTGVGYFTPLFTVESFSYKATYLTIQEMATILQMVATGHYFDFTYMSPYYGTWRTDEFYVGKGSLNIGWFDESTGHYDELSMNIIGRNPI